MSNQNGHPIRVAILKSANILIECGTSLALSRACYISPYHRSIDAFNAIIRMGFSIFPTLRLAKKNIIRAINEHLSLHHLFEPYNYLHHIDYSIY